MNKIIPLIICSIFLVSCNSTSTDKPPMQVLTRVKYKAIRIPNSYYDCPVVEKWPNPATLSDIQVANLLVELYSNNHKCKNSLNAIKTYIEKVNKVIEE